MTPETSYSQEFDAAWQQEKNFIVGLGFEIDCAILFGSLSIKKPRMFDKEFELKNAKEILRDDPDQLEYTQNMVSNFPNGVLTSDADILVFCTNLSEVTEKLKIYYQSNENLIYNSQHELYAIAYFGKYDRNLSFFKEAEIKVRPFSPRIPKAEIFLDDAKTFVRVFDELINTCSEEKDEVYAGFGFRNDPKRGGIYGTERLYKIKKCTVFIQAIRSGKIIEGQISQKVLDAVEIAEKNLEEFHSRCAPRKDEISPNILLHY